MSDVISHCAECGRPFMDDFAAPRLWCSVYCETQPARFAAVEARGAAAERAAVVAFLRANVAQRVLSLADTIACIERGDHRHKGEP